MAYTDLSATFVYKSLLTYQQMDGLGENDKEMYISGNFAFSPAKTRYYIIGSGDFVPESDVVEWEMATDRIFPGTDTDSCHLYAGIHLPNGAIITSFKVYWFRDDGVATGTATLYRHNFTGTEEVMGNANSDAATGNHSVEDTTIGNATIDNSAYHYLVFIDLDPNNAALDVYLYAVVISYTITTPLP